MVHIIRSVPLQVAIYSYKVGILISRQAQEQLEHLGIVGCAQSSNRIPSLGGIESKGAATRVGSVRDVVQHSRVLVQH